MVTKTALMLDFDGVLLKNPKVQKYVAHKCTEYLAKRTGTTYAHAKQTNDARYPVHGHTARVLEKDFGLPCGPREFNQGVYGSMDFERVRSWLTQRDAEYARTVLDHWNVRRENTFVFTGAPRKWVLELREALALPFEDYRVLGSDVLGHFKPDPRAYAEAEFFVRLNMPQVESFCLVDDGVENVKMAMVLPRWTGVLYPAETNRLLSY